MSRRLGFGLAGLLACLAFAGCAGIASPVAVSHPFGSPASYSIDHFGPGETPAVTLYNCSGETMSWEIVNLANGQVIQRNSQYVPRGNTWTVSFPRLAPGSYYITFAVHGAMVASTRFLVSG